MKRWLLALSLIFIALKSVSFAQNTTPADAGKEPRVALGEQATAFDTTGTAVLGGRLRTIALNGTPDAPIRNARFIIENRSAYFYTYASGVVTFYDATGVRCGQGLWNLDALAPNEMAEVDTPDLRVTCAATVWRIVATSLITRNGSDIAKPNSTVAPTQTPPTPVLPVPSQTPNAPSATPTPTPANTKPATPAASTGND